jgi:nucleoid-associated protein YgaU
MALNTSSRYTTAQDATTGQVIAVRKPKSTYRYSSYVTREGDTFEILAVRIYRDPLQYWRIADINPQLKYPDVIPAGTLIRLPS